MMNGSRGREPSALVFCAGKSGPNVCEKPNTFCWLEARGLVDGEGVNPLLVLPALTRYTCAINTQYWQRGGGRNAGDDRESF